MSFADAEKELGDAVEAEFGDTPEPAPVAAPEQAEQTATPGDSSPAPEAAAPAPAEDTFDGGKFNPDTLSEELQPGWKQLQAEYTRKTQELAEQRKQFEALGSVEELQVARELYARVQDPTNWPALHAELSEALEQQGVAPAAASAEAARQIEEAAQPAPSTPGSSALDAIVAADPELAPLVTEMKAIRAENDQFKAEQAQVREQARQQQEYMALVGELQRQENFIREANPTYKQTDIDAVYELSSFYNGNLIEAETRLKAIRNETIEQYLAQKESVNMNVDAPVPGGSGLTQQMTTEAADLDEAEQRALEEIRNLGLQDATL